MCGDVRARAREYAGSPVRDVRGCRRGAATGAQLTAFAPFRFPFSHFSSCRTTACCWCSCFSSAHSSAGQHGGRPRLRRCPRGARRRRHRGAGGARVVLGAHVHGEAQASLGPHGVAARAALRDRGGRAQAGHARRACDGQRQVRVLPAAAAHHPVAVRGGVAAHRADAGPGQGAAPTRRLRGGRRLVRAGARRRPAARAARRVRPGLRAARSAAARRRQPARGAGARAARPLARRRRRGALLRAVGPRLPPLVCQPGPAPASRRAADGPDGHSAGLAARADQGVTAARALRARGDWLAAQAQPAVRNGGHNSSRHLAITRLRGSARFDSRLGPAPGTR